MKRNIKRKKMNLSLYMSLPQLIPSPQIDDEVKILLFFSIFRSNNPLMLNMVKP